MVTSAVSLYIYCIVGMNRLELGGTCQLPCQFPCYYCTLHICMYIDKCTKTICIQLLVFLNIVQLIASMLPSSYDMPRKTIHKTIILMLTTPKRITKHFNMTQTKQVLHGATCSD